MSTFANTTRFLDVYREGLAPQYPTLWDLCSGRGRLTTTLYIKASRVLCVFCPVDNKPGTNYDGDYHRKLSQQAHLYFTPSLVWVVLPCEDGARTAIYQCSCDTETQRLFQATCVVCVAHITAHAREVNIGLFFGCSTGFGHFGTRRY